MGIAAQVIEELKAAPPKRNAPGGGNQFRPEDGTVRPLAKRETPNVKPTSIGRATQRHVD